jgi:uroporphyrinogen decarboxylase
LPREVALIGFAGAPWTVATYMVEGGTSRDFHHTKLLMYRDPASFAVLIDRLVAATVEYLLAQVAAGAEIIQLFDTWAGVLPEAEFGRWVVQPTKRIVTALRARHPDLPIIGFPRGAGFLYPAYFAETGVTAVSLDTSFPLTTAREALQPIGPVQGNLDPLLLVAGGAAMRQAVTDILLKLAAAPFVFNLGHGIVPETPPDHVAELVAAVRHG